VIGRQPDAPPAAASWLDRVPARLRSMAPTVASTPRGARRVFALGLLAIVGLLDAVTGSELSISVFYLVPVLFADAALSRADGRALALLGAATWGVAEVLGGRAYSAAWVPVWNSGVRLVFFLLVNELADANRVAHGRDRALARTDSLTGVANGRTFTERVELAIAGTRRHGRPFTIAYVDLDRFKQVNDRFGHAAGDRLLRAVAATIDANIRATDLAARLGGDEFGVLLVDTDAGEAERLLGRLSTSLATNLRTVLGEDSGAAATFGSVTFREAPASVDAAIHEADSLMYTGKQDGGARIVQATWPQP